MAAKKTENSPGGLTRHITVTVIIQLIMLAVGLTALYYQTAATTQQQLNELGVEIRKEISNIKVGCAVSHGKFEARIGKLEDCCCRYDEHLSREIDRGTP